MGILVQPKLTRLSFRRRRRSRWALVLISLLILVLAGSLYGGFLFRNSFYPAATGKIRPNLYVACSGMSDVFLIKSDPGYIAIDAGDSAAGLREALSRLKIAPASVSAVFLTHSDNDHTAGLKLFPKARIYLAAAEVPLADGSRPRALGFIRNAKVPRPYQTLRDGETITLGGNRVRAIATPGHTPGSLSYLIDGILLFSGDTLTLRAGTAHPFYDVFNMSPPRQRQSIKRLAKLEGIAVLCTAHTGYTLNFQEAMAAWKN